MACRQDLFAMPTTSPVCQYTGCMAVMAYRFPNRKAGVR